MLDDYLWILDNGMFTKKNSIKDIFVYMRRMRKYKHNCKFVVCPDEVGNALMTQYYYRQFSWRIKAMGWPVAFVAQDGQESYELPQIVDAVFIGGTTKWKLSRGADICIEQAKRRQLWVHVGRVNSKKRILHFWKRGVDSVDGTHPIYEPSKNIPKINKILEEIS